MIYAQGAHSVLNLATTGICFVGQLQWGPAANTYPGQPYPFT